MDTLAAVVAGHARGRPGATAFVGGDHRMTWAEYDARSDALAATLIAAGYAPGDRIAVMLPDGPAVHTAFLAIEKAGCVIVGIGPRAGIGRSSTCSARRARPASCRPPTPRPWRPGWASRTTWSARTSCRS